MSEEQEIPVPSIEPKKSRKKLIAAVLVVFIVIVAIAVVASSNSSRSSNQDLYGSSLVKMSGAAPTYDEQEIIAFNQNFTVLSYNFTAVAQQSHSGYGPAYLLNGVSNTGYWYQVGISYKWHSEINGTSYRDSGFSGLYEAFEPNATSVFPSNGGSGTLVVDIQPGDAINLALSVLSNQTVEFQITDFTTNSQASAYYNSFGATYFAALSGPYSNSTFFTGLMTEFYHVSPYYGNESKVTYTPVGASVQGIVLAVDEYNVSDRSAGMLFYNQTSTVIQLSQFPAGYTYSYEGITITATPRSFTTG